MQALTLLQTIYDTSTSERRCHIHITHDGSDEIREYLVNWLYTLGARQLDPERIRVTLSKTSLPKRMWAQYKTCASARLMLAEEHKDVAVAMYIDGDARVQHDVSQLEALASSFNQTQWCGMTQENEIATGWYVDKRPGSRFYKPYGLNSGVMLLNLTRWRQTNFTAFALSYDPGPKCCGDQDTLNVYFESHRDEMYVLPCTWNRRTFSHCPTAIRDASIIHGSRGVLNNPGSIMFQQLYSLCMKKRTFWSTHQNQVRTPTAPR